MTIPPRPTSFKTKLFGDNRFNFYGWIMAGLFIVGVSAWAMFLAVREGVMRSAVGSMLLAIYFLLLGLFCIAWQNYCARVARKLDAAHRKLEGPSGT